MKVSVGPHTVAVVGLCPLPLPSLAPHPMWGGQGKGNRNLKSSESLRMCVAILVSPFSWSLLISLLVSCSGHVCCLSECLHPFPSDSAWFVLPWAWRGIRDYEKCSGAVDELLWVSPSQLPSFSLGGLCELLVLFPWSTLQTSPSHPPSAPGCALRAPLTSKLVESLCSCQRPGCLFTGKKGLELSGSWRWR